MLEFTSEQLEKVKGAGEDLYKSLAEVYCPYLKENISFGAPGLEHLKFKRREKSRPERGQYIRFKLIHLAPEILKLSHTVQGILETKKFERIRMNGRTEIIMKPVTYYEFIAIIKRNRVIVKQIDYGQKFFWSLIPFWGMNQETKTRFFHDGFPEED